MEQLNRLGWTSGVSINAYGVTVGVRTNDASQLGRIQERLPYGWRPSVSSNVDCLFSLWIGPPARRAGQRNFHLLYADAARTIRTLDLDELYNGLENQALLAVAYWASPAYLFVHAGVVAWNGKAIVIPGRSHSGKSTLVAELVRAGATYYSDEMAVFDGEGWVHPYGALLTLRHENGQQRLDPAELGVTAEQPLPVGLVFVTEYAEGGQWRPRTLTPGRALMALLNNTVAVRRTPDRALEILGKVAASGAAIKSKRGEAASVARKVLDLLAAGDRDTTGPG